MLNLLILVALFDFYNFGQTPCSNHSLLSNPPIKGFPKTTKGPQLCYLS